jgi:hypothetical protein
MPNKFLVVTLSMFLCFLVGCGGGSATSGGGNGSTITSVAVSPSSATLFTQGTQLFAADVQGTGVFSTQVTWLVNDMSGGNATLGTISAGGLSTAPAVPPSSNSVTITGVSTQDTTKSGTANAVVSNSVPALTAINPASSDQGVGPLTITISGSGFNSTSSVTVAGRSRSSTFVDTGHLQSCCRPPISPPPSLFPLPYQIPRPGEAPVPRCHFPYSTCREAMEG